MKLKFLASTALAMTAASLLLIPTTPLAASETPIPGVDIIVKKKPGGVAIVANTTDKSGQFTARFAEPGDYTISFACRAKTPCPRFAATIAANGQPLKSSEAMTYDLTVDRDPVTLTGSVETLDDRADASTRCPQVAANAQGQTRILINTTRSNIKHGKAAQAEAADDEQGQSGTAINTSRSNIKHGAAPHAEADKPCDAAAAKDAPARR
ncbi:MAG: carboxypeptidase-like regulatory domain-containing protein [Pseudomonadota bacterium]